MVRLVGGGTANFQGRVEVKIKGNWGRVCGVMWDLQDANVVCRQLGYERAVVVPQYSGFEPGTGQIWMDNVQCIGNESSLFECKHDRWGGFRCKTHEEAWAVCKPAGKNNIKLDHIYSGESQDCLVCGRDKRFLSLFFLLINMNKQK